jgi:hypothetical protein
LVAALVSEQRDEEGAGEVADPGWLGSPGTSYVGPLHDDGRIYRQSFAHTSIEVAFGRLFATATCGMPSAREAGMSQCSRGPIFPNVRTMSSHKAWRSLVALLAFTGIPKPSAVAPRLSMAAPR